ncbi:Type 1 phosphatases regulator ypi1 [Podila humilis]|nr:Type 1 phosphatases regulator ypi1 [Podila humilis]
MPEPYDSSSDRTGVSSPMAGYSFDTAGSPHGASGIRAGSLLRVAGSARRPATHGSRTMILDPTETVEEEVDPTVGVLNLTGEPSTGRRVQWDEEVVDNEHLGKKKSKICCIFKKQKEFGESSDESSSSESDSDSESDGGPNSSSPSSSRGHGKGQKKEHEHEHDEACHNHGHHKKTSKPKKRVVNEYERMPKEKLDSQRYSKAHEQKSHKVFFDAQKFLELQTQVCQEFFECHQFLEHRYPEESRPSSPLLQHRQQEEEGNSEIHALQKTTPSNSRVPEKRTLWQTRVEYGGLPVSMCFVDMKELIPKQKLRAFMDLCMQGLKVEQYKTNSAGNDDDDDDDDDGGGATEANYDVYFESNALPAVNPHSPYTVLRSLKLDVAWSAACISAILNALSANTMTEKQKQEQQQMSPSPNVTLLTNERDNSNEKGTYSIDIPSVSSTSSSSSLSNNVDTATFASAHGPPPPSPPTNAAMIEQKESLLNIFFEPMMATLAHKILEKQYPLVFSSNKIQTFIWKQQWIQSLARDIDRVYHRQRQRSDSSTGSSSSSSCAKDRMTQYFQALHLQHPTIPAGNERLLLEHVFTSLAYKEALGLCQAQSKSKSSPPSIATSGGRRRCHDGGGANTTKVHATAIDDVNVPDFPKETAGLVNDEEEEEYDDDVPDWMDDWDDDDEENFEGLRDTFQCHEQDVESEYDKAYDNDDLLSDMFDLSDVVYSNSDDIFEYDSNDDDGDVVQQQQQQPRQQQQTGTNNNNNNYYYYYYYCYNSDDDADMENDEDWSDFKWVLHQPSIDTIAMKVMVTI